MAVEKAESRAGQSVAIGLNVVLMIVLVVALVAGFQWIGYSYGARADLTSTGVNSLTDGTVKMISGLDQSIRLSSLYFETDLEDQEQARYRSTVADLLELYHANNRSKIVVELINPLQDHEKRKALIDRVTKIERFAEQTTRYREAIDKFTQEIVPAVGTLMADELNRINAMGALNEIDNRLVSQVKLLYERTQSDIQTGSREITDALASEAPAYSAATAAIRRIDAQISQMLEAVTAVSEQVKAAGDQFSPAVVAFFTEADQRYQPLLTEVKAQQESLGSLPRLESDDILRAIGPMSNAVVVESDSDVRVIEFRDMWPAGDQSRGAGARNFAGEQKLSAAILQLTQETKPAVMFVRFGGPPLLVGGFMPGQPQPPLAQTRERLEELNFVVNEWDLATQETQPEFDPAPSRVIYVVLPPNPPPRGPMGQQSQQPPFSDKDLKKLTDAMGDKSRALFMAGFTPGQFGMAESYAYNEYLKGNWGVRLIDDRLLFRVEPVGVDKYQVYSSPIIMTDLVFGDHPIVKDLGRSKAALPIAAPIETLDEKPEGVDVDRLAWMEHSEGLWAIKDVQFYQRQASSEFLVRGPEDYEDEFTVAVAGERGDAKMVLIGSSEFAFDRTSMASIPVLTSQGLTARQIYPGNFQLLVNSIQWLNDNTEWMNLGGPVDPSTIAIDRNSSQMALVKAMAYVVWPGIFLLTGFVVWWTRRS